jgi:hypothetical protein
MQLQQGSYETGMKFCDLMPLIRYASWGEPVG